MTTDQAMPAAMREFAFNAEHFRVISARVYEFSGIRLPEAKREVPFRGVNIVDLR